MDRFLDDIRGVLSEALTEAQVNGAERQLIIAKFNKVINNEYKFLQKEWRETK